MRNKASQKETPVIAVIWNFPNMPAHVDNFANKRMALPSVESAKALLIAHGTLCM
jgi:hypothetical protein